MSETSPDPEYDALIARLRVLPGFTRLREDIRLTRAVRNRRDTREAFRERDRAFAEALEAAFDTI